MIVDISCVWKSQCFEQLAYFYLAYKIIKKKMKNKSNSNIFRTTKSQFVNSEFISIFLFIYFPNFSPETQIVSFVTVCWSNQSMTFTRMKKKKNEKDEEKKIRFNGSSNVLLDNIVWIGNEDWYWFFFYDFIYSVLFWLYTFRLSFFSLLLYSFIPFNWIFFCFLFWLSAPKTGIHLKFKAKTKSIRKIIFFLEKEIRDIYALKLKNSLNWHLKIKDNNEKKKKWRKFFLYRVPNWK